MSPDTKLYARKTHVCERDASKLAVLEAEVGGCPPIDAITSCSSISAPKHFWRVMDDSMRTGENNNCVISEASQ